MFSWFSRNSRLTKNDKNNKTYNLVGSHIDVRNDNCTEGLGVFSLINIQQTFSQTFY